MKESDIPINFLEKSNIKDNYNLDDIEFIVLDINNKIRQKYIEVVKNKIINHTSIKLTKNFYAQIILLIK